MLSGKDTNKYTLVIALKKVEINHVLVYTITSKNIFFDKIFHKGTDVKNFVFFVLI